VVRALLLISCIAAAGCNGEGGASDAGGTDAAPDAADVVCGEPDEFLTLPLDPSALDGCTWFRGNVHVPDGGGESLLPLRSIRGIDGRLTIFRNHGLPDLRDLGSLELLGGELSIESDDSGGLFTSLDGLASLGVTGGLVLGFNPALADLRGLSALRAVRGDVRIRTNSALPAAEVDWLLSRVTVEGEIDVADNAP